MPDRADLLDAERFILAEIGERVSAAKDAETRAALCRLKEIFQRLSSEAEALHAQDRTTPTDPDAIPAADDSR